jgi:hypothetical protein
VSRAPLGVVGHPPERGGRGAHVGQRRARPLAAVARELAQRGALEALGLAVADRHADAQRVAEIDAGQLGGGGADDGQVAGGERAPAI